MKLIDKINEIRRSLPDQEVWQSTTQQLEKEILEFVKIDPLATRVSIGVETNQIREQLTNWATENGLNTPDDGNSLFHGVVTIEIGDHRIVTGKQIGRAHV